MRSLRIIFRLIFAVVAHHQDYDGFDAHYNNAEIALIFFVNLVDSKIKFYLKILADMFQLTVQQKDEMLECMVLI